MSAGLLELLHVHLRATLAANGVKEHQLPEPLHVPRPTDEEPEPLSPALAMRRYLMGG